MKSLFSGFDAGKDGVGIVFGEPFGFRYQKFTAWDRAFSLDAGYKVDDKFVFFGANYHFYTYAAEDSWRELDAFGHILYNFSIGTSVGLPTDTEKEESERVGIRLGGAFEYLLPGDIFSVRIEVAPTFYTIGKTAADVQGGIILLYYLPPTPPPSEDEEK